MTAGMHCANSLCCKIFEYGRNSRTGTRTLNLQRVTVSNLLSHELIDFRILENMRQIIMKKDYEK